MASADLRPMTVGDIFDVSFAIYRKHLAAFFAIGLIAYIPYGFFLSIVAPPPDPEVFRKGQMPLEELVHLMLPVMGTAIIFLIVVLPLCRSAVIHRAAAAYRDRPMTVLQAYWQAILSYPRFVGTSVPEGIIVFVGLLCCVVPSLLALAWLYIAIPIAVLERLGPFKSISRSYRLVEGNVMKALGLVLLSSLFVFVTRTSMLTVNGLLASIHPTFSIFCNMVLESILLPVESLPPLFLYYDLRIRREAIDLQVSLGELIAAKEQATKENAAT